MATATLLVAGLPVAVVWWLRATGSISSPLLGVILGMALSLCASQLGRLVWEKLPASEDLLFSELMLWGFLHRWRTERRLASAHGMLGRMSEGHEGLAGLSPRQQAKLLERLVAGMETRDPYLHGHSRRVARHSWMIAKRMGLPRAEVARIRTAAAVHDVGKIETPKSILHKPGPLTADEYDAIKRHPGDGAQMAAVLRDDELTAIVRHHHERLDGTGYPNGLAGDQIALGARIIAVADTFDAITSARPYRLAKPQGTAIDILKSEAGVKLDPVAVRAFCSHYAGRRSLALWAFVAALPERVLSWLGGSVASVVSAAKVLAVAALVGGTAATTSTLALPAARHHSTKTHAVSATAPPNGAHASPASAFPARSRTTARTQTVNRARRTAASSSRHVVSPSTSPGVSSVAAAGVAQQQQSSGAGAGQGVGGADERALELGRSETPAHGKTEQVHGKSEAPHVPAQAGHGKGEAPRAKGEEGHGKSGEAPSKSKEAPGNAEAPHGKSEEAPGKTEAPHGKSEEAPGKSEAAPGGGKSEEAHGKSEEPYGKSEEAHGKARLRPTQ